MREVFVPRKAEDESGLTPGEDDNEAWRGKRRKDIDNWMGDWYEHTFRFLGFLARAGCVRFLDLSVLVVYSDYIGGVGLNMS